MSLIDYIFNRAISTVLYNYFHSDCDANVEYAASRVEQKIKKVN